MWAISINVKNENDDRSTKNKLNNKCKNHQKRKRREYENLTLGTDSR